VWQTVLTQHGLKVRTDSWNNICGICTDFMPWLRAQGFNGKYLIMESIERNLLADLDRSVACQQMQYHLNDKTDTPRAAPAVSFDVNYAGYAGKLSTGIQTQLNVLKYEHLSRQSDLKTWLLSHNARMVRVADGCKYSVTCAVPTHYSGLKTKLKKLMQTH